MMQLIPELFTCVGPRYTNMRWGQILDFSSIIGVVEVVSSGNAQERGVADVTRISRLLSNITRLPTISILKKKIDTKPMQSLVLCSISETVCDFQIVGQGKIFLRRGKILAPLLIREGMVSGSLLEGDCLVLLSKTSADIFASEENELFSPQLTPKEIAEAISIRLGQEEQKAEGAAALVIQIKRDRNEEHPTLSPSITISNREKFRHVVSRLSQFTKRPKFIPYTAVVCIVIFFLGSVALGINKQVHDTVYKHRGDAIQNAQRLLEEGIALTDIRPINSRELLQNALQAVSPYTGENLPRGKDGKIIEQLEKQIKDSLRVVAKIYTANVQLFYDASFLQKNRVVSLFTVGDNELAFADTTAGMIGIVSLTSKNAAIVAGGEEYKSTTSLSFQDSTLFIVTNDGVKTVSSGSDTPKKVLSSESWDAFTTYGGNIYGVQRSEGKILRYPGKENRYGASEEYLDEDIHADLTQTSGISIDGSIWLGSKLGKIFRYTQGRDDSFFVRGVDPPLGQQLEVFVSDDRPSVYIFDPEGKRIVILSKEGLYQGQYVYSDTIQPTAFGISPVQKRVYLLADQKIYSFSIE